MGYQQAAQPIAVQEQLSGLSLGIRLSQQREFLVIELDPVGSRQACPQAVSLPPGRAQVHVHEYAARGGIAQLAQCRGRGGCPGREAAVVEQATGLHGCWLDGVVGAVGNDFVGRLTVAEADGDPAGGAPGVDLDVVGIHAPGTHRTEYLLSLGVAADAADKPC